ncbi:GerMN domain-containing protein [Evansella sp. AB-rgal1]|uniref:GerMN domain-containing protein n=1 Tax=Evansella sp. AB-rgal1 TaxID=3242696 RepID=UPI00359CD81C
MRRLKTKLGWGLAIATAITLTACGSDPVDENVLEDIDPPQQIEFVDADGELVVEVDGEMIGDPMTDLDGDGTADEGEDMEEKGGPVEETVMRELYLMDRNGYVAPQTINIPSGENEVEKTIEYLVKGGPVTDVLPNGFQATLPSGTELLGVEVAAGVVTLDFSEQFEDYHPEQELQILQSLTWTVTQLDDVDRVKLKVNGEALDVMPQNGTPIANGYTRSHGINLEMSDFADLSNTKSVIVYFLNEVDNQTYYVPVTRRVPQQDDVYQAVVGELLKGPNMMSPLLSDFDRHVELLDQPVLSNGTLTLNFSEQLLNKMEGEAVSNDVINMLVLSLTEQQEVQSVSLQVDSNDSILVTTGETLTEPVARPNTVNTGEY